MRNSLCQSWVPLPKMKRWNTSPSILGDGVGHVGVRVEQRLQLTPGGRRVLVAFLLELRDAQEPEGTLGLRVAGERGVEQLVDRITRFLAKPLSAAEVVVDEDPATPGYYSAKVFLKPHYQLEGLTVSLRLVAKLPSTKS